MRLSTLAALMILTTLMLSACSQEHMAAVEDKGNTRYGREMAMATPTYSRWNPAPENPATDYKYSGSSDYSAGSGVDSVSSSELAPPSQKTAMVSEGVAQPAILVSNQLAQAPSGSAAIGWQWPVDGHAPYRQAQGGIVIEAPEGTPVRAAAAGEVIYEGQGAGGFGQMAILRHADGSMTSYAHAQEIIVSKGDTLQQGDLIGYVGRTGNAPTPQLHFAMRRGGESINPTTILPQQMAGSEVRNLKSEI